MTNKFNETIGDKLNKMNKEMGRAREQKRKELEEKYIPKNVKDKLTPEEIQRYSQIGIGVGLIGILLLILFFGWYLWNG